MREGFGGVVWQHPYDVATMTNLDGDDNQETIYVLNFFDRARAGTASVFARGGGEWQVWNVGAPSFTNTLPSIRSRKPVIVKLEDRGDLVIPQSQRTLGDCDLVIDAPDGNDYINPDTGPDSEGAPETIDGFGGFDSLGAGLPSSAGIDLPSSIGCLMVSNVGSSGEDG